MPFFVKPIARGIAGKVKRRVHRAADQAPPRLHGSRAGEAPWFAGSEFSAADIQMSFPLEAAAARAGLDASRPRLIAFLERIHARPAYQRALERGGPYELMS